MLLGMVARLRFECLSPWLSLVPLGLGLSAGLWGRMRAGRGLVALACLGFGFGFLRLALALPPPLPLDPRLSRPAEFRWRAESYADCSAPYCSLRARLLGYYEQGSFVKQELGMQLKGRGEFFAIPGEVYRSTLRLREPRGFRNAHSFDYPRYLRRQGVSATAFLENFAALERESPAPWPSRWMGGLRRELRSVLQASVPDPRARGVLAALLLGDGGLLEAGVEEDFRRAGLTHVLVVSGLHFTFVTLFFFLPAYAMLALRRRWSESGRAWRWAFALALPPVLAYGLLVGLSPSVMRGLGACALVGLARLGRWRRDFGAALLGSALLLLAWQPLWLFSLSFQLSFLSVTALYFLGRAWRGFWKGQGVLAWALTTLYSTCAVNLALLPLLARSFHEVSLIAPLSNLLFVPYYAGFLLPAELLGACSYFLFPSWGEWSFAALGRIQAVANSLLSVLAGWRHATWLVRPWSASDWLAYAFGLGALLSLGRWRRSGLCLLACLAALLTGKIWTAMHPRPPLLTLRVLDVGQGESLLLQLPDGQGIVLDGGGFPHSDFDMGKNVVLPELLASGLERPVALALSHPDADHWKGLKYLAERLDFGEFWVGAGTEAQRDFAVLNSVLAKRGRRPRRLRRGEKWAQGGAEFTVLWPPGDGSAAALSDNDRSLVLKVCFRQVCLLLTGDLEAAGEAALLAELSGPELRVLKVAHHGSATSSGEAFLRALRPTWALISVGAGNRYRLPQAGVLARLGEVGARVYRTDLSGELELETDGRTVTLRPFIGAPVPSRWSAIRGAVFGSGS